MIKVTIEKTTTQEYKETVQFTLTEEPTAITKESEYGNRKEVTYKKTFEPREVSKFREVKTTLLSQEIGDESQFNLGNVIKAINGL